ncbi:MAG: phosphatase PAP2 family protein [Deltaproteobacteria bacterium]|nr:MAG: phosphatase PAP2 family protein [Deltaproteobacteria bacterium]
MLGEASALGAQSPPLILGGTALTIAGLALFADDASDSARQWKHLEIFAVSQAVTSGLTDLLKVATWRERPDGGNHLSFPSGHTSSAFAWATFVWRRYGWQWGLPAYVFAAFVGFSRIHDDRHWLSDVLAGALLGVSVTYVVDELYGPLD